MTISLPQDDQQYNTRNEMFETVVSFLGGRVAEQLRMGDISDRRVPTISQRATGIRPRHGRPNTA